MSPVLTSLQSAALERKNKEIRTETEQKKNGMRKTLDAAQHQLAMGLQG
jgi:hypothetical protein